MFATKWMIIIINVNCFRSRWMNSIYIYYRDTIPNSNQKFVKLIFEGLLDIKIRSFCSSLFGFCKILVCFLVTNKMFAKMYIIICYLCVYIIKKTHTIRITHCLYYNSELIVI